EAQRLAHRRPQTREERGPVARAGRPRAGPSDSLALGARPRWSSGERALRRARQCRDPQPRRDRQRRGRPGVTTRAPFGTWRSPITAGRVAVASAGLGALAGDGDAIYWLEGRPAEGGRSVLVRWRTDGGAVDVTPPPWNVRTRVHEYGGGSFTVA